MPFPRSVFTFPLGCLLLLGLAGPSPAEVLYSTDFESFLLGDDKIAGAQGWLGTTATTAAGRSGVSPETGTDAHGVPGLGKAGWIGGNTTPVVIPGTSINVRKSILPAYDPTANNKEIVFITCLLGVQPSVNSIRDDFEIFIMNGSSQVIAALQFDSTTLGTDFPRVPLQTILRSNSVSGTAGFTYTGTDSYFLYDVVQAISIRINWRTNRWSALLDDTLLFNDQPFYLGTSARNLGAVGFRMHFGTTAAAAGGVLCTGGSNFALFDDLSIQVDPFSKPSIASIAPQTNGSMKVLWPSEAGYSYKLWRSPTLGNDWTQIFSQNTAATSTSLSYTDATAHLRSKAFYRVTWSYP